MHVCVCVCVCVCIYVCVYVYVYVYIYNIVLCMLWASLVAQLVKNPPAMWETWVSFLDWEDLLERGKATHPSVLGRRIPWTIQSMEKGLQTVGHDVHFFMYVMPVIYIIPCMAAEHICQALPSTALTRNSHVDIIMIAF